MPSRGVFRMSLLAMSLALSGCLSLPQRSSLIDHTEAAPGPHRPTIGELPRRHLWPEQQKLAPVPPEQVLATYQQALALFSTSEQRSHAMRRMADLTMIASEGSLDAGLSDDASPNVFTGSKGGHDTNYKKAISLYEQQIASAPAGTDLSETLYLLAKAYDLDTQPDQALTVLDRLSRDYPGSPMRDEVEFRRGEQYFTLGRYQDAALAYKSVIAFGEKGSYYENSLYKLGWSLYKQADYEPAIERFIALLDRYLPPPPPPPKVDINPAVAERLADLKAKTTPKGARKDDAGKTASSPVAATDTSVAAPDATATKQDTTADSDAGKASAKADAKPLTPREKARQQMEDDTLRAIALAFSNLDGPASVPRYLNSKGDRHYSYRLYEALARLYIFQERYRDAADAYGAFIEQHPYSPKSPGLSSKKIEVYAKGGFAEQVLNEKRTFVEQYGIYSAFWKRANPDIRAGYLADLKRHVLELAQHYHAQGQKTKNRDDYKQASRWYNEYIASFPQDDSLPMLTSLLGETLFASEDFTHAVEQFERSAYDLGQHAGAEKAGYFSLLAYEESLKRMDKKDPVRGAWVTRSITADLRFIKTWPQNEHVAELYENVLDNQLALNDIKGASATAATIIKRTPPVERALFEKAWIVQANAQFDQGDFVSAEGSLKTVLGFASLSKEDHAKFAERRATAIYKQAELLEKSGMKDKAADIYLRAAESQPDTDVSIKAEFDAANLLMESGKYKQAIEVLERFREKHPDHKLAKTIPAKLSIAYEKTGNDEGSARELERIASTQSDNAELGHQALQQAAELHEKKGNRKDAIRLYRQLEADKATPFAERVELRSKLAGLYEQNGDNKERDLWLASIVDAYKHGGNANTNRTRFLAAEASFRTTEPLYEQYTKLRLTQPLAASIKQKKQAMSALLDAYKRTAEIGVLQFTTACTYRMGEAYREFAKAIMTSERPSGMSDDALEEYQLLLEDQSQPMEEQAIALQEANAKRVHDGAWDDWVKRSLDALGDLQPGRYKKPERQEEYVDDIL